MSFLLVYHDRNRALAASDDLSVTFGANGGGVTAMPGKFPKFLVVGSLIFFACGRTDVVATLRHGFAQLHAENPNLSLSNVSEILADAGRRLWGKRVAQAGAPSTSDAIEYGVVGYDSVTKRVRAFVSASYQNDFAPVETTADPHARVFALGAYGIADRPVLEALTRRLQRTDRQQLGWVAAALRDTIEALHGEHPESIGAPSFYGALNSRGVVDLPPEFPTPVAEKGAAVGAHLVTTNKAVAMDGINRFFCGSIVTPAQGALDTTGNDDGGSSSAPGITTRYFLGAFGKFDVITPGGNGVITAQPNEVDGNLATFAEYQVTGNSSAANSAAFSLNVSALPVRRPISETLKILYAIPTNSLAGSNPGARAVISVVYQVGSAAPVVTNLAVISKGVTVPLTTLSLDLPVNATLLVINGSVVSTSSDASGTLKLDVYEIWVEAVE